jgi:hypothetical protein
MVQNSIRPPGQFLKLRETSCEGGLVQQFNLCPFTTRQPLVRPKLQVTALMKHLLFAVFFEGPPILVRPSNEWLVSAAQIGHHFGLSRDAAAAAQYVRNVKLFQPEHARAPIRQLIDAGRTHCPQPQHNAIVRRLCGRRFGGRSGERVGKPTRQRTERACGARFGKVTTIKFCFHLYT